MLFRSTLKGKDTISIQQCSSYTDPGYTGYSSTYGTLTSSVVVSSSPTFNNMLTGTYVFTYSLTDPGNNVATPQYRYVIVSKDTTPPKLIVANPDTTFLEVKKLPFNPLPIPKVVSANDLCDGNLTGSVTIDTSSVQTNILGIYRITYSVTDLHGNKATVYRYLDVIDTLKPVLTLNGQNPDTIEVFSKYVDAGVTVSDNYYTPATLNPLVKVTSNVDTAVLGVYTVTYNLTDPSGNIAKTVTRTVVVVDHVPPIVILLGPKIDSVEVFDPYNDPGVKYSSNYYLTSALTLIKSGTFITTFGTKNPNITGVYTIVYTATDPSGNKASVTRIVKAQDRTAPVITLKGPLVWIVCQDSSYANYHVSGYTVSDNYNTIPQLTIDTFGTFWYDFYPSIYPIKSGLFTIRYSATDKSGNIGNTGYQYVLVKSKNDPTCGINTAIDTTVCKNGCPYFTAPISGSKYIWSTGGTTRSIQFCPKNDTAITVGIIKGTDTTTYIYGITVTTTTCVWPGDANGDGIADNNDILAIGVAYADTGAKRAGASLTWTGQPCDDWANSFKSGVNHKNADCNGDGVVDSTDMKAVSLNYGDKHSKAGSGNGSPSDPPLSVSFSKDSSSAGDTLSATISLGTDSNQVFDAYGLAFSVHYSAIDIKAGKLKMDFSNCWMGTPGKNLITFVYNDSTNDALRIGITRIDHKNVTGYGELGKINIVMQDNVGGKTLNHTKVYLAVSDVNAISYNESTIPLYATSDSMKFSYYHLTGINNLLPDNSIQLYPNPVSQSMTLDAGYQLISEIRILNILGEQVYANKTAGLNKVEIPASQLPAGVYSITITTKNGSMTKSFMKE